MIDFTTALGRLLRHGSLREAFAADTSAVAEQIGVRTEDRDAFCALSPEELEVQADILLRKRFGLVEPLLPGTCASLGDDAWASFRQYARSCWHEDPWQDANGWCGRLAVEGRISHDAREACRARFVAGSRLVQAQLARTDARSHRALLIHLRGRENRWLEMVLRFGL